MRGKKTACTLLATTLILAITMVSISAETQITKLFVDPPKYTATQLGEVFTINVNIANVSDLKAFDFKLGYNTTLLDALNAVEGPFPPAPPLIEIHEPEGYIYVCGYWLEPAEGNGTMVTITFNATHPTPGSCTLDLYDTLLFDSNMDPIPHEADDGYYEFGILEVAVATDKPTYLPGENVEIHGNLTLGGSPRQGLVGLEVRNPRGYRTVLRTLQTGAAPPPGDITIVEVFSCDMWGDPKESFTRGTYAYFSVTVRNSGTEPKIVTIAVNAYDGNMVPLPGVQRLEKFPLPPGTYPGLLKLPIYIPDWAYIGTATVYASALTDWPKAGGVPYCPEESATFNITNSTLGAAALEKQGSGNNANTIRGLTENAGDYSLTFRLPPEGPYTPTGVYRIYASSFHEEQFATGSTAFGVNVICVPYDYPTIQEAVNAATPTNNSILVLSGTYNEHVTINEPLTLIGLNPSNTIINGSGTGTVVTVSADNVEISRFTIQNSGNPFPSSGITLNDSSDINISENTILNNYYGIYLNHSTSVTLEDNKMICNKYNFGVFGDSISHFSHDINTSNTVDGKPIYYWVNQHGGEVPPYAGYVAIVNSTSITVRNLTLTKNGQGVLFAFTNNSFIEEGVNTTSNEYGIYLVHSYNNIIVDSAVSNNKYGICLYNSGGNSLVNNDMWDNKYNFGLYGAAEAHFDNAIYISNTVDGKPVYYVKKASNTVYDSSTNAGTLYLIDCDNVTIKDLTLIKNVNGIFLWNTTNSKIQNINASNNLNGIHLQGQSNYNNLNDNTVSNNDLGIYLDSSNNSVIYHNSFIENTIQVNVTESYNNLWDNDYPSGGNYWSDYSSRYPFVGDEYKGVNQNAQGNDGIWDHEYVINENNTDNYPLISPLTPPVYNIDTHLGYTKIQEAINATETSNGHTIIVRNGTYYEHVTIDKSLTLIGIIRSTVIDGSGTGTVVNITANHVTLKGFTINGSGSTDQGILLFYTTNTVISQNTITKNNHGIWLHHSSDNYIYRNKVTYNDLSINLTSSNDNAIYHNDFVNNTQQMYNYSSVNTWHDGFGKGNYWSDYEGEDLDSPPDGVGDTLLPHQGVDWYPLMNPGILVHDIAVTNVTFTLPYGASHLYPGWVIDITVTVKNEGDYTETFLNIYAYYDNNPIPMKIIPELTPQAETAINLTWDTTGVSPGNYTIKAAASEIPGETETDDNTNTDGMVQVNLLGDVDSSGKVNILDVGTVCSAYATGLYDPAYDLDMSGPPINILDVGTVCSAMVLFGS